MGYEVCYKYKESAGSPGVYSDEIKDRMVMIGSISEDVSLEALASKLMTQLARRNIFIVDVEIYEYARKKVSYRETESGIVIKNRKFSFDSGRVVETDDLAEAESRDEDDDFKPVPSPSRDLADKSCPLSNRSRPRRPIRQEIYDPEPMSEFKAKQKGLKFTKGRKYPIYSESSMGSTVVYKTKDDAGKEVDVSSEYFVAIGAGLVDQNPGPEYVGAEDQRDEINLWRNYEQVDMPEIRRR